ncbi:MAG: cell division protein SepF [Acidimicrobiales bacterium]
MEHLGLVDPPEYEDGYAYGYDADAGPAPVAPAPRVRDEGMGTIRPLPRDPSAGEPMGGGTSVTPIPRPVRPVPTVKEQRVHVVKPQEFSAGQEIGDRIKQGAPVVVSVVDTDPIVGRRIIDFCSACVYMVDGRMQRVAKSVFLLTPSNVEISDSEKRRLHDQGLYKLEI